MRRLLLVLLLTGCIPEGMENGPPLRIELDGRTIEERLPAGTAVGVLSTLDPGDSGHAFTVVDGGLFVVIGNELVLAAPADYEAATEHLVEIEVADPAGLTRTERFTIDVLDVEEVTTEAGLRDALVNTRVGAPIYLDLTGTMTLTGGALTVGVDTTIIGLGAGSTTISGGDASRVFVVDSLVTAEIHSMSLTAGFGSPGGAVINRGRHATLDNVIVYDNFAPGLAGLGGGVHNDTVMVIRNSTIRDNRANSGGGLSNEGVIFVDNTTISGNDSLLGHAGAIWNEVGSAIDFVNSTLSGNTAVNSGGAIYNKAHSSLVFENCTITGNSAGNRGGAFFVGAAGELQITRTVVAGNVAATSGNDLFQGGGIVTGGYNIVGDGTNTTLVNGDTGDSVGTNAAPMNAGLEPLADNGGSTRTHGLAVGSPAVDAVPIGLCGLARDQRGVERPQGDGCDVGAVEYSP